MRSLLCKLLMQGRMLLCLTSSEIAIAIVGICWGICSRPWVSSRC